MALRLAKATVITILNYVQTNLPTALKACATLEGDNLASTEPPKDYFNYYPIHGYRRPAIMCVCRDFSFRLPTNANFHNAAAKVFLEAIVEDKTHQKLFYKTWLYQAALVMVLDGAELTDSLNRVRLICKVLRTVFSGDVPYPDDADLQAFSKSVMVELEVEHYENKSLPTS
jgi:hypothetical protein